MKPQEFMLINSIKFYTLLGIFFMGISCSSESTQHPNESEISNKKEIPAEKKAKKGVLYEASELALVMRSMYANMTVVGEMVNQKEAIPDSLLTGYERMLHAEATNPEDLNEQFYGFANVWLDQLKGFKETPDITHYNEVMNACVHCHQSFCPGPIKKINRLKLVP